MRVLRWPVTCVLLLAAIDVPAQVFKEVTMSGRRYTPQELTIEPGTTVIWRNIDGFHNIVSDTGLFNSGNPRNDLFAYEFRFDQPGIYGYHCTVHGSPGEGHFGRILVRNDGPPDLSRAHSGSWFNAQTDGQGLVVEVSTDASVFTVAWFTWGEPGSYEWLTGAGSIAADTASVSFTRTRGGAFNSPQPVNFSDAGTGSFRLTACDAAEFSYTLSDPPRSGTISLRKLLPPGPECPFTSSAVD